MAWALVLAFALTLGSVSAGAQESGASGDDAAFTSRTAEQQTNERGGDQSQSGETAADQAGAPAPDQRRPPPDPENLPPDPPRPDSDRYALVIGNEHYRHYPDYPNGAAAAEAMAEHLSTNGYTLVGGGALVDASWRQIAQAMIELKAVSREGGVGVL